MHKICSARSRGPPDQAACAAAWFEPLRHNSIESVGGTRRTIVKISDYFRRTVRKRSALAMTETELRLMAAAAIIGLSNRPKTG